MRAAQGPRPIVAIVQARMGSTRLPGKVLAEVGGRPILAHVVERLRRATRLDRIVIATTTHTRDDAIVSLAEGIGIPVYRGSEPDVLGRYQEAAEWIGAKTIVRVCGEDVFVDPTLVDRLVQSHLQHGADYTTNVIGRTFPEGQYVEVLSHRTLARLARKATWPEHREHVTQYILDHPQGFRMARVEATGKLRRPEVKLSVDTREDLAFVRMIYDDVIHGGTIPAVEELLDLIDQRAQSHASPGQSH